MTEDFKKALTDFSFDAACGKAIRHLCDLDLSAEEIQKRLDYPVPLSRVEEEVKKYKEEKEAIESGESEGYRIVKEYGKFGKTTFRKVPLS